MSWFVYIIEASDNSLYTGITTDLERRFQQHSCGTGAKYFNGRSPVKFVYTEVADNRSRASVREAQIKKLTRAQKQQLIMR
ncbi:MAG: GIY-YIG nuclease family protein [Cycloclasticus sp.]|nr:endonuclease [Cycloclasticus sp. 44_32_T64]